MEEEQVEGEIASAHLHREFGTDKAEVPSQLQQELFHSVEQATVQVVLGVDLGQSEKLDSVGVLEDVLCPRVHLVHQRRHFYPGESTTRSKSAALNSRSSSRLVHCSRTAMRR
jgi:hypothetical protein